MEDLKTILAENKWFPADGRPQGWENLEIRKPIFFIPEFLINSKDYETGIFYNCLTYTNWEGKENNYIEGVELFIKHVESNIVMTMRGQKSKYSFYPAWFHMFKSHSISAHQRTKAIEAIDKPNLIGIFTDKKMFQWAEYCENYINALNSAINEVEKKNENAELEIEKFIKDLKGKCNVERWAKYTIVHTDYFKIEFSLDKTDGYLSKKIQYNGDLEGIIFLTNKY